MSRELTPTTNQIVNVQSTNGFSVGEYIYATSTGLNPISSVGIGTTQCVIGGVVQTGVLASATTANLISPSGLGGTYTGSTIAPNVSITNVNVPTVPSSAAAPVICALTNGNFAVVQGSGSEFFLTIYSGTGAVVSAQANMGISNRIGYSSNSYGICGTADGGFALFYGMNDGFSSSLRKYNASGTQQWAITFSTGSGTFENSCASSSNGNIMVVWSVSNSGRYAIYNSSGVVQVSSSQINGGTQITTGGGSLRCTALTSDGNSYFATTNYDTNNGQNRVAVYNQNTGYVNNQNAGSYGYYTSLAALVNGQFMWVWEGSGSFVYAYFNSSLTNTFGSTGLNIPNMGGYGAYVQNNFYGCENNQAVFTVTNNSGQPIIGVRTGTSTATSTQLSSRVTGGYQASALGLNGKFATLLTLSSNYNDVVLNISYGTTQSLSNGSAITGSITYPTYTFYGVSVSNCSPGGVGKVLIKGVTSVNSNYGSASTPTGFNVKGSQSPIANSGYVVGRSVTLEGI